MGKERKVEKIIWSCVNIQLHARLVDKSTVKGGGNEAL